MKSAIYAKQSFFTAAASLLLILVSSQSTFGYEEDTHFLITYVICRSVGFTEKEALIVAAVDEGLDDSKETNAHDGAVPQVLEEWMWHALDKDGKMHAAGILARRDMLFNDAVNEKDPRNRLIRFGIFFHFQQDTWAHRHHERPDHLSLADYTTFNTPAGHGPWGSQPDRPPLDPVAAVMCLEEGIGYASKFLKRGMGREPNAFFAGYKSFGGKEDADWKDKRNGKYFNQIDLFGISQGTARMFINSLIRAQIDAYPASRSPNPFYAPRDTADHLEFEKARAAFQVVCGLFQGSIGAFIIPTRKSKEDQGFTTLTTQNLLSLKPGVLFKQ